MVSAKQLRILFVDDEKLEVVSTLKNEGYDVDYWADVENLENIVDGRYHVVFLDVRGIGSKYGGNGLDIVKYVGTHNPLVFTIVFSAKPFTGAESDLIRQYAKRSMEKDCTFYEVLELLEEHAKSLSPETIIHELEKTVKVGLIQRWQIRRGSPLSRASIEKLAKSSGITQDAVKIVSNTTAIAVSLFKLFSSV
jgi:DNA-binding NtrC family response regulator